MGLNALFCTIIFIIEDFTNLIEKGLITVNKRPGILYKRGTFIVP